MRTELQLQVQVCEFLRQEYPEVMFHSDISAGMALSIGQAQMNKRLQVSRGMPDIYIFEARGGWSGLFLELKAENSQQIKKDGTLGNEKHIVEQRDIHTLLKRRGYWTDFYIGLDQCKHIIRTYMSWEPTSEAFAPGQFRSGA